MLKTALMHHMNLAIDDVEKARDFYGQVLDLQEIKRPNTGRLDVHFVSPAPVERHARVGGHPVPMPLVSWIPAPVSSTGQASRE